MVYYWRLVLDITLQSFMTQRYRLFHGMLCHFTFYLHVPIYTHASSRSSYFNSRLEILFKIPLDSIFLYATKLSRTNKRPSVDNLQYPRLRRNGASYFGLTGRLTQLWPLVTGQATMVISVRTRWSKTPSRRQLLARCEHKGGRQSATIMLFLSNGSSG